VKFKKETVKHRTQLIGLPDCGLNGKSLVCTALCTAEKWHSRSQNNNLIPQLGFDNPFFGVSRVEARPWEALFLLTHPSFTFHLSPFPF
jgi:hypothetical protein